MRRFFGWLVLILGGLLLTSCLLWGAYGLLVMWLAPGHGHVTHGSSEAQLADSFMRFWGGVLSGMILAVAFLLTTGYVLLRGEKARGERNIRD